MIISTWQQEILEREGKPSELLTLYVTPANSKATMISFQS